MKEKEENLELAHCNVCGGERNHLLLYHHKKEWNETLSEELGVVIYSEKRHELLQCAGCDHITLRYTTLFSEDADEHGRIIPRVTYYPPPVFRPQPRWLSEQVLIFTGPAEFVSRLLNEIYTALHGDCLSLAAMGVRSLLERVMIDRVGDCGSFGANLKEFQKQGFIAPRQSEILDTTLDFGHASTHRDYVPTRKDIRLALDITENVIEMVYVSYHQASELKKKIPPRKKSK